MINNLFVINNNLVDGFVSVLSLEDSSDAGTSGSLALNESTAILVKLQLGDSDLNRTELKLAQIISRLSLVRARHS